MKDLWTLTLSWRTKLSNEDVRALVDIRTSEQEALRQVLEEIK